MLSVGHSQSEAILYSWDVYRQHFDIYVYWKNLVYINGKSKVVYISFLDVLKMSPIKSYPIREFFYLCFMSMHIIVVNILNFINNRVLFGLF